MFAASERSSEVFDETIYAAPTIDDNLVALVGRRLRRLRKEAGVSLREQARALGMSPSSLSELENARGGISLRRLQQVADHFGLHVTDLLADEANTNGDGAVPCCEVIRSVATVPGIVRGHGVRYQLLGASRGHALQAAILSFEPGGGYEDDKIGHPGEEFLYVVYGCVELLLGEDVHRLGQGDGVRFRAEVPHALRNAASDGMAVVIGAATPPW
jgi:quercetin dioxygenase-like cupin family protein/DNA-binding XRE family transcriptional regulator